MKLSGGKYGQLAKAEEFNRGYFSRVLRLAYLALISLSPSLKAANRRA